MVDLEALMRVARVAAGTDRADLIRDAADEIRRLRALEATVAEYVRASRGALDYDSETQGDSFEARERAETAMARLVSGSATGPRCTCMRARSSACKVHGEGVS